jgi:hypothetical protein
MHLVLLVLAIRHEGQRAPIRRPSRQHVVLVAEGELARVTAAGCDEVQVAHVLVVFELCAFDRMDNVLSVRRKTRVAYEGD